MDISIIFVNWNAVDYIRESIASIYEQTSKTQYEIVVVDNASPAGNVDVLKQEFPEIILIKSPANLGFAKANNLGYKHSSGEYILFLNPDTKLISPAIDIMHGRIRSQVRAGVVGCKLLNEDLTVQTSCIQRFPTILNQVLDADYLRKRWPNSRLFGIGPLFSPASEPVPVEVISGACMMIGREVFNQIRMFSEDFFMYAEDLDLCYKSSRTGYINYYCGDATVIHYGGKSSSPRSATIMKWKSLLHYCQKNRGLFYSSFFRIAMVFVAIARLLMIKGASMFGNTFSADAAHSAQEKWSAILRTLVTQS